MQGAHQSEPEKIINIFLLSCFAFFWISSKWLVIFWAWEKVNTKKAKIVKIVFILKIIYANVNEKLIQLRFEKNLKQILIFRKIDSIFSFYIEKAKAILLKN